MNIDFNKTLESENSNLLKQLRETEKKLQQQKGIFQEVLANTESIAVQGYNNNHEVIYWNKASESIYGYTKEEALGKKLEDLIIPSFMRDAVHEGIDAWMIDDISIPSSEIVLMDKNGNDVNVFSQHVMIKIDSHEREMYCLDINLKEIKKLQHDLELEKSFLNVIFDVIPDLIWLKNKDGVYLKCNRKFENFFGAKESEILNKTDYDFVDKELADFFREHDMLSLQAGKATINEEYLVFADNSSRGTFETIKVPMKDIEDNVVGILGIARDISERKSREEQLEKYANYDALTGLTNRTVFMDRLTQLLDVRESSKLCHAVLFIDLDGFKEINDTAGHSTGDKLLIMVADRLQSITRKGDTLARLGGDEFTILLVNIAKPLEATTIAQKIIDTLNEVFFIDNHKFYITASTGIAISPNDSTSPEKLLQFADSAMYKAKEKGKNTYEFYTKKLSIAAIEKINIVNALRNAIKYQEFELYYQAQTDVLQNKTIGAEALIRWNQPKNGMQVPAKFIPFAESSGLITEIGKWVIHQGMKDIVDFKQKGLDIQKISINLSPKQLSDKQLIPTIIKSLKQTGANPEWIEFEVTETYTMENPEASIIELNKLVDLGFSLSIDDFGTGYSSLSYLKKLPISKLKIDKSFVDDIQNDNDDKAIVQAVILIAKSMRLDVIAEGVEKEEQQKLLLDYGCNLTQGYLYSKPLPKNEFEEYVSARA